MAGYMGNNSDFYVSPADFCRTGRDAKRNADGNTSDLVILHTQVDQVFEWARYIKGEVESRCRAHTQANLISSVGFLPEVQDNVRRTLNNTPVLLLIVSPDLVTKLETIGNYSFDFLSLENMAGAVLFFCGVDEQTVNLRKYFPNYEVWKKFVAQPDEHKIGPIFQHIAKLIDEAKDSSPEPEPTRSARRATEGHGMRNTRTLSSAAGRPPHRQRRSTLKEPVQIFPDRGPCDQPTDVAVILSDDLIPCDRIEVQSVGQYTNMTTLLKATRLNNCTFQITMPESMCEDTRVSFFRDGRPIGSAIFHYESPLDEVEPLMQLLVSAMDALCELVATSDPQGHSSRIDQKLTHLLQGPDIPIRAFEQLFYHYTTSTRLESSPVKLPTLLHMVAKFGLHEVASMLVDLPGAKQAGSITNLQGRYPNDIARAHGYHDLASFFDYLMGLLENEEEIYSSMKAYITLNKDGISPLSQDELNCTVPLKGRASTTASSQDYYCMSGDTQQDTYMPMAAIASHHNYRYSEPPKNLHLGTPVPGPGPVQVEDTYSYLPMTALAQPKLTTRRPPPPPPRDVPESPGGRGHKLERGSGIDFGSRDDLDGTGIPTVEEQLEEPFTEDPVCDSPPQESPEKESPIQQSPTPEVSTQEEPLIGNPIVPFENLLAPNTKAPQLSPATLASDGQAELLDILYQVRDGDLTLQDAEFLVDGWKKQYNGMNNGRWNNKKSFKEKKESLRALKDSYGKTAEKLKEELKQPDKPRGIMGFFRRKKAPAPKAMNKQVSAPVPPSEPMVDVNRLQVLQQMYHSEESTREVSGDPVCQSIPELPSGMTEDSKRFSTISTSSSSSTVSSMSRTSCGSQQDSGIDVPIREESPALTGNSSNLYDNPACGPPRPVLPVPASGQGTSSDECQSGYEDMDSWLEPDGGSIRSRMQSDSSTQSGQSVQSVQSAVSDACEDNTPTAQKCQEEAPPIPPRSRLSSASSMTDIPPAAKSPNRGKILPPKRKSGLPQPRSRPPIGPKPQRSTNSESSGSEDPSGERRTGGGISVASVVGGASSVVQAPRTLRPPGNYSNVMLDLNAKLRNGRLNGGTPKGTPMGTPVRTPRCSTSDDSEAPVDYAPAPPVPPRNPRD